ncbi:MAG: transporter substrate-binding domain-containing protein, partial [Bifidobacteriaceae bacterium]|nr:transporter substrate-binding domain-containing protein [Bifidobacteriaceae bacterium]
MIDAVNIKRVLTVALFALLALFLSVFISGCSSGSDSAGGKTYKIVTDSIYAPFEFEDSNNTYVGIDIDLFDAIAKQEG